MLYDKKIVAESVEDAFHQVLNHLKRYGERSCPRGNDIIELQNCNIIVKNPRNRIIGCKERNFSAAYAFGELAWYLSGNNRLDQIVYYSKFQGGCSDDGETLNSAYGARIFGIHPDGGKLESYYPKIGFDQWAQCVKVLRNDRDSRQAIIHLHTANDQKTKDEVCTLTLQFLIRDNKLNMITTMRSNDIILGFTYDAFAFTVMQELMANELGVELGYYCHNVGSMHIYTKEYYGKDFCILDNHTPMDVAAMQPIRFRLGDGICGAFLDIEKKLRETAQLVKGQENNVVRKLMIENGLRMFDNIRDHNQEFMAMALGAFIIKMLGYTDNADMQPEVAQWLRDGGFEFAADICALQIKNARNAYKVVLEGPDGTGKSAMAVNLKNELLQNGVRCAIIHYTKPSDIFNYECGYTYNLQKFDAQIFDRFAFSEIVYADVLGEKYGRKCKISESTYRRILQLLQDTKTEIRILCAINPSEEEVMCMRRSEEDDPEIIVKVNNRYLKLYEELKNSGYDLNVKLYDVYGIEQKEGAADNG